jgi:hypothetical protein
VYRLAYNGDVVAFKMGRRSGGCPTRGGRISESIGNRSGGRRPIFNATLRAAASWLFFRPAAAHARQHKEAVQISSHRYGRDALPRDPAWHVSKVVFGFSRGRSRMYSRYGICSRLWTCHAGSRGSASLPWGLTLYLMLTRMGDRQTEPKGFRRRCTSGSAHYRFVLVVLLTF